MKNKPCWNSKAMGMHLAHTISIIKNEPKKFFFASWLSSVKFTFFFQCLLRQVGVAPSWQCHALFHLAPNSWDPKLSADVSFVSVLAMDLSEFWKRLDKNFQKRLFPRFSNKKSLPVFNILRDPMQVQKQTIHQPKGLDLSFNLLPWKWLYL